MAPGTVITIVGFLTHCPCSFMVEKWVSGTVLLTLLARVMWREEMGREWLCCEDEAPWGHVITHVIPRTTS